MEMFGMGGYLRSAPMEYVSLLLTEPVAHDVLTRLGNLAIPAIQFTDMNGDLTAFKRHYTPFIRRCDDLEKKLAFFEAEMTKHGIEPEEYTSAEFTTWVTNQRETLSREHRGLSLLDYWESIITERHRDYTSIKTERDRTAATLYQAVQRRLVIEQAKGFFLEARAGGVGSDVTSPPAGTAGTELGAARIGGGAGAGRMMGAGAGAGASSKAAVADAEAAGTAVAAENLRFRHIAGIISTEEKIRFGRIIFRASAGHAVVRFADIYEPLVNEKGDKEAKSVFCIFYRGRTLGSKLDRICTAFNAHQHDIPSFSDADSVREATDECKRVMDDSIAWLRNEAENSATSLRHIALLLRKWKDGVRREKAIYHTLNQFQRQGAERGGTLLYVQAWVLRSALQSVHDAVQDAHASAASGGRMLPYVFEVLTQKAPLNGGDHGHGHSHGGAPATANPGDLVMTSSGATVSIPSPPTHFNTNKVTAVFQGIVNTYGVPRYGEANPAIWSIATFPFLFGVMYGDIGHATFISIAALYLLLREEHYLRLQKAGKLGEMLTMAFKGRYMIFFMGLFGIYCGLIYNDFFSIGTNSFGGTRWYYPTVPRNETLANGTVITVDGLATVARKKGDVVQGGGQDWNNVYTFGVDPTWHSADNDLLFFNSLKMKTAVIIGIIQMTFGLFLKVGNALHFNSKVDLFLEAIPQVIFMVGLFGYMVFLIVLKWCINWNDPATAPGAPPSLIDTLINVVLKPGTVQDPMFASQASLQVVILLIVFFCVPIMLFGKPLAVHFQSKAAREAAAKKNDDHSDTAGLIGGSSAGHHTNDSVVVANPAFNAGAAGVGGGAGAKGSEVATAAGGDAAHHGGDAHGAGGAAAHGHSFGDVFVHQAIETIEFVLGSVSNTASYLRLWALSLAHSQLATVFWERALQSTIESGSAVMIFVGWGAFAMVTLGVLLLMDVLECFLHALRLHWVEFQNKFFKADGYKFVPFSFAALAQAQADH